jgi:glycosyltransferase involved in cell wall biosynthesis/GT2 family glycosyltransferase
MIWNNPKSLSVVINTCNRANSLEKTILSIFQQSASNVELIVVNGPSTDHTNDVIEKYKTRIKIRTCNEFNLSISRNIGIAAATGDIVAFIDDDAFPEPGWAKNLLGAYDSEDIGGVGGFVFDHTGTDFQTKYIICDRFGSAWPKEDKDPSELYSYPNAFKYSAMIGTNCSFRRDILLEIGAFDEEYEYFLDETDVCVRVIDAGYKIKQIDNAYVHHKFLPSHMRNSTRATVHHFPILKNSLYFALKYVAPFYGVNSALIHADNVFNAHLKDAKWFVEHGQLPYEKLINLPKVYNDAKTRALSLYENKDFKYIGKNNIGFTEEPFKPLVVSDEITNQICIVLLCRNYDSSDSGIARFIKDQALALAACGHIVHVLTLAESNSTIDWEDGVWVHRIQAGYYSDVPNNLGFKVNESQWCYSRSMLDEVRKINLRHKVDIVEAPIWDNEAISFVCFKEFPILVNLQTSIGIALRTHPEWEAAEVMRNFVLPALEAEKYILKECDGIRAISNAIVKEIELVNMMTIDRDKVNVIPLFLRDRNNNNDERNSDNTIVFLGRLEPRKGIDLLLAAIPLVLSKFKDVNFKIIGDASINMPESDLTYQDKFSKEYPHLLSKVEFFGKISDEAIDLQFKNANIFVAPSRFESFGLIFVEAMMFSLPIVSIRSGGIPEVVTDKRSGILVNAESATEISNAICELLSNKDFAKELGANGRIDYETKFSQDSIVPKLVNYYEKHILNVQKIFQ